MAKEHRTDYESLEQTIGHTFENRELMMRALTHSSYANEHEGEGLRDNERLEFLGDSVLGLAVSDMLFNARTGDEGELTRAKSYLVSARYIGRLARKLHLGDYLLLGFGEEKDGGRRKNSILADVFEALTAAIYLDGGMEAACRFVRLAYGEAIEQADGQGLLRRDYKSFLQELIQAHELPTPRYSLLEARGPDHSKIFTAEVTVGDTALGRGSGGSKKAAEQQAAKLALEAIESGSISIEELSPPE